MKAFATIKRKKIERENKKYLINERKSASIYKKRVCHTKRKKYDSNTIIMNYARVLKNIIQSELSKEIEVFI